MILTPKNVRNLFKQVFWLSPFTGLPNQLAGQWLNYW